MLFIRPVEFEDLDAMLRMSEEVGSGMTTMPVDEGAWLSRIRTSLDTFESDGNINKEGVYFMVAEDSKTQQVVGTTAVYIGIGTEVPFYSYRQTLLVKHSKELKKMIEIKVLNLVNDFTRASEIGSLFLSKSYRHSAYGQFMSRSRYLLMADFPERFADLVMAEMRGWQDEEGNSPFWQALGKKFFEVPFENADYISATRGSLFIQELMPKYPVYIDLLPEEAKACIGKPHAISAKAIHMLEKEGFYYDGYVDVFDGGPTVQCRREHIQSVQEAKNYTVSIKDHLVDCRQRYIMSNRQIEQYRLIVQPANLITDQMVSIAEISPESAEVLGVTSGDTINVLAMQEKKQ